jgi:hypothetical protein
MSLRVRCYPCRFWVDAQDWMQRQVTRSAPERSTEIFCGLLAPVGAACQALCSPSMHLPPSVILFPGSIGDAPSVSVMLNETRSDTMFGLIKPASFFTGVLSLLSRAVELPDHGRYLPLVCPSSFAKQWSGREPFFTMTSVAIGACSKSQLDHLIRRALRPLYCYPGLFTRVRICRRLIARKPRFT